MGARQNFHGAVLLELVAETCERQVQMTRDLSVLQDGVARLFENLARLVRQTQQHFCRFRRQMRRSPAS